MRDERWVVGSTFLLQISLMAGFDGRVHQTIVIWRKLIYPSGHISCRVTPAYGWITTGNPSKPPCRSQRDSLLAWKCSFQISWQWLLERFYDDSFIVWFHCWILTDVSTTQCCHISPEKPFIHVLQIPLIYFQWLGNTWRSIPGFFLAPADSFKTPPIMDHVYQVYVLFHIHHHNHQWIAKKIRLFLPRSAFSWPGRTVRTLWTNFACHWQSRKLLESDNYWSYGLCSTEVRCTVLPRYFPFVAPITQMNWTRSVRSLSSRLYLLRQHFCIV